VGKAVWRRGAAFGNFGFRVFRMKNNIACKPVGGLGSNRKEKKRKKQIKGLTIFSHDS
jgi:hypothetical protein